MNFKSSTFSMLDSLLYNNCVSLELHMRFSTKLILKDFWLIGLKLFYLCICSTYFRRHCPLRLKMWVNLKKWLSLKNWFRLKMRLHLKIWLPLNKYSNVTLLKNMTLPKLMTSPKNVTPSKNITAYKSESA